MEVDVDYPDQDAERKILFDTTGAEESRAKPAMTTEDLLSAQRLVRRLPVGESVVEAILALVRSARPGPEAGETGKLISWGPGPRASQALMLAVRAKAPDELVVTTDAISGLGMPVGSYFVADRQFFTDGVVGRLADGTLSGSVLPLNRALRNLVEAGATVEQGAAADSQKLILWHAHFSGKPAPLQQLNLDVSRDIID